MRFVILLSLAFGLFSFWSCGSSSESGDAEEKLSGLQKYYYPDGTLYMEVNLKDSIPNGLSKIYFKNGQMFEETEYTNGVKHGIQKRFYEDGKLSLETPYDSGRIHGVQKKFRKDGTPAYEAPYYYDKPCVGLKEYYTSGNPVKNYPSIKFETENLILQDNRFILRITLSENTNNVEFFKGKLTDGKYISKNAERIWAERPGIARIDYFIAPGTFVMENLNIIAKVKTDLGNYYITERRYNVAEDNRY